MGFDWDNTSQVLEKLKEELNELEEEIEKKNAKRIESEFGIYFLPLLIMPDL